MLYNDDCLNVFNHFETNSFDLIFADPPYFLSNDGLSINSGKVVSVNKGAWDKKENYNDVIGFTKKWISQSYRVLKNGGSFWVSGTHHNIFDIRTAMLEAGFKIMNIIIWHKVDPPPLLYKIRFKYSYEFIIWGVKGKCKTFNYQKMFEVDKEEMHDVWNIKAVGMNEKKFGYHPTQKPEELLERIITASSNRGDSVLDPFMGSGTTCFVAKKLGRKEYGIEKDKKYFINAQRRIKSLD